MTEKATPAASFPSTTHYSLPTTHYFLILNALALLAVAVWFRCYALSHIPGINGDEAWYGVQAWRLIHGIPHDWHTPTGNPLNPMLLGPLALLHGWLPPSFGLLRAVAVAGGLAALAINWFLCGWVFDRRTAACSTVLLAILPINIVYSRLAWDTNQTLAATLPVVYFALAAVRFPDRWGRWIAAALLAGAAALWVHPTNLFAGGAIAIACLWRWRQHKKNPPSALRPPPSSLILLVLALVVFAAWLWASWPLAGRVADKMGGTAGWTQAVYLYPRLFTGGTVYRYTAGSRSWFEWPSPEGIDGLGADVVVFWLALFAAVWLLLRGGRIDRVLLAGWGLGLAAFLAIAGTSALMHGQERYALCLIAPAVIVLARGAAILWEIASRRWRFVLAAATLVGWPLLADFNAQFFCFIERTGGRSEFTFRTAAVEPKQAAWQAIQAAVDGDDQAWIVSEQWWIRWPICYLALSRPNFYVVDPQWPLSSIDLQEAVRDRRLWHVEFCDTDELRQVESELAGRNYQRWEFLDYARRPIVCVLHADGP